MNALFQLFLRDACELKLFDSDGALVYEVPHKSLSVELDGPEAKTYINIKDDYVWFSMLETDPQSINEFIELAKMKCDHVYPKALQDILRSKPFELVDSVATINAVFSCFLKSCDCRGINQDGALVYDVSHKFLSSLTSLESARIYLTENRCHFEYVHSLHTSNTVLSPHFEVQSVTVGDLWSWVEQIQK